MGNSLKLDKKNKKYDFEKVLAVFIRRYELSVSASANLVTSFLSLFVTFLITFIIAYIGWNVEGLKTAFLMFYNGNLFFKFILLCVIFTPMYFTYRVFYWIVKFPKVERFIFTIFRVNNLQSEITKLNLLYLASLNPESWEIEVDIDEEKGIFNLLEIRRKK